MDLYSIQDLSNSAFQLFGRQDVDCVGGGSTQG